MPYEQTLQQSQLQRKKKKKEKLLKKISKTGNVEHFSQHFRILLLVVMLIFVSSILALAYTSPTHRVISQQRMVREFLEKQFTCERDSPQNLVLELYNIYLHFKKGGKM